MKVAKMMAESFETVELSKIVEHMMMAKLTGERSKIDLWSPTSRRAIEGEKWRGAFAPNEWSAASRGREGVSRSRSTSRERRRQA